MLQEKRIEDCTIYSDGRCYNHKRRRWSHEKNVPNHNGYILIGKNFLHRMIAKEWIPNPDNHPYVNHKNGIKTDNRIENLEWCTQKHNVRHAYATGLIVMGKGEKASNVKLSDAEVIEVRRLYAEGVTQQKIAEMLNNKVTRGAIARITNKNNWKHL